MEAVRHELETWRIELFGGLRVVRGDHRITRFRTQKTELLLAYLAYYPQRPHSRERLIDLLWPESELSSGRQSLSQALSSLRLRLMPPDATAEAVIDAARAFVRPGPRRDRDRRGRVRGGTPGGGRRRQRG
jgi:DNA-binding SARP family transcriptional activator